MSLSHTFFVVKVVNTEYTIVQVENNGMTCRVFTSSLPLQTSWRKKWSLPWYVHSTWNVVGATPTISRSSSSAVCLFIAFKATWHMASAMASFEPINFQMAVNNILFLPPFFLALSSWLTECFYVTFCWIMDFTKRPITFAVLKYVFLCWTLFKRLFGKLP